MGGVLQNKKVAFLFFKFFLEFGFAVGFFAATSLFISRVGTFSLFYIYFGASLLALLLSFGFSKVIDRYSRKRIFFGSFFAMGLFVILGWFLVSSFPGEKGIYFALRIFCYSVLVITGLEFWVLASLSFSHSDSKRVFSQFVVVSILGEMAGGVFTIFASRWLGTENLLLVWGLILCTAPLVFIRFSFPRPETAGFSTGIIWGEVQEPGTGFRSRSFFSSRLIQVLFFFWIAYSFICYGTDYVFNSYAVEAIHGEDALTSFFGKVSAAASFGVLLYHSLLGPRIARYLGPAQSLGLLAALVLVPWIVFTIHPSLVTIAIANGVIFYFSDHFSTGIHSTILTVFPERVKGRIRVLTEGLGRPLGTVLLFLLGAAFAFQVSIAQMHYWMLGASVLFLGIPFLFRKPYGKHLLNCLHSRDQSLVLNSVQALGESPQQEAVAPLISLLHDSRNFHLRRSVVMALEHIRSPDALQSVLPFLVDPKDPLHASAIDGLRHCPDFQGIYALMGHLMNNRENDSRMRIKSFEVLKELVGKEVVMFILGYLYDHDPQIQYDALRALAGFRDRRLIDVYLAFLKSENPRLRSAACIALHPFARTRERVRELARAEIERLARSAEAGEKIAGFEAIGALRLHACQDLLEKELASPDKAVLRSAAGALALLRNPAFLQPFLAILLDGDEAFAVETAREIVDFPPGARQYLFKNIHDLQDVQQAKILNRLRKTREDFSADWGSADDREAFLAAQMHA